jgi:hypothetical protein
MALETGETFSPSIRNPNSGATGLIQFMPAIAPAYGTTTTALAQMTAVEQLDYVKNYFSDSIGRLNTIEDVYARIFWPAAIGKPDDYVIAYPTKVNHAGQTVSNPVYTQNSGFDVNHEGVLTKRMIGAGVRKKYDKGMGAGFYG